MCIRDRETDTSEQAPTNAEVRNSVLAYYRINYKRGLYKGLELFDTEPTEEQFARIRKMDSELLGKWSYELSASQGVNISAESRQEIQEAIECIGEDVFVRYLQLHAAQPLLNCIV